MQINSIFTSSFFIAADKICDFIPIVSSVTNIYILFKKRAYKQAAVSSDVKISPCYTHLKNKQAARCLLLMIPGINIIVAIYYAVKGHKSVPASTVPMTRIGPTVQKPTSQAPETTTKSQSASAQPKSPAPATIKGPGPQIDFRNMSSIEARNAFTKSLGLDPIEWEDRGYGAQYVSQVYQDEDTAKRIAGVIANALNDVDGGPVETVQSRSGNGTRVLICSSMLFDEDIKTYLEKMQQKK